jgi:mannose-6-phosphate isomerase-like protein (cupin superfamily)
MRRVVTGNDAKDASAFVSDEEVDPVTVTRLPGASFVKAWGSDGPVVLPTDGSPPATVDYLPPPGGFRFDLVTLPPAGTVAPADLDPVAAQAEMEAKLPGLARLMEPDHPGMHTTDSVDFDVVISGEVWLEVDDGKRVLLRTGDCVVLNGTRHSWANESDQPCVMVSVLIGAERRS